MKNNKELLINSFSLENPDALKGLKEYPFSIPVIKNFKKIIFKKPVTFIIGENGSGKSTLIEAFAKYCGFNAEGGSRNIDFSTRDTTSGFHEFLHAEVSTDFRRFDGYFLRSETLYNLASEIETRSERKLLKPERWVGNPDPPDLAYGYNYEDLPGDYGDISLHKQSHGESVLSLLNNRLSKRGVYLFDEPETGLSIHSLFMMLCIINNLAKIQAQFIICTHSPILLAIPKADIYEIKDGVLNLVQYEETSYYNLTRYFILNYNEMLKKLGI
jgi:predicted ATPase